MRFIRTNRGWIIRALAVGLLIGGGCAPRNGPPIAAVQLPAQPTAGGEREGQAAPVELPAEAGLADLLRYAEAHHPALQAAHLRWRAAREAAPQARALPDPALMLGYDGMDRRRSIGVSQVIPFPGKLGLRGRVAEAEALAQEQEIHVRRLEVLQRVGQAWAEYVYLGEALRVSRRNVELGRELEQIALASVRAGGPQADLLRAQIELARLQEEAVATQDMQRPAAARLNSALGRPPGATLPPPTAPVELAADGEGAGVDEVQLAHTVRQLNPELEVMRTQIEQARRSVQLARRETLPDFGIELEYMREPMEDGFGVGLMVTVPVWQQRYRAAQRQANLQLHAATQALLDRELELLSELEMALFNLRDAERKIALFRDTLLPRATQALRSTEAAYRAGTVDFQALLEAYRLPLEFELALARARADRALHRAVLETLTGETQTNEVSQ